ncbi:putative F-box domain-containing protein [Rosa chinensis]|uniref:Putative F-box domain-containing protein n=1 Tax=Rosa chinensis TaxID=74649 RepID=A0A2P6QVX0_ROSCH|nr:F-box protein At3g07870 [Rosa chinensis]PRQ38348.1 putative F-box domain-containing protein [Rosa chinensis]
MKVLKFPATTRSPSLPIMKKPKLCPIPTDSPPSQQQQEEDPKPCILLLPNHITVEIFSKLPITTLIQCRCVCKSWRHSLSDPHFARYLLSLTPPSLLIKRCRSFYLVEPHVRNGAVIKLAEDPNDLTPYLDVVGSCNGLLAVRYNSGQFYISNPILGEFLTLPRPRGRINCSFVCGFGFSPVSNVYKLVMASIPRKGSEGEVEVMVLTVGSGIWRSIGSSVYPCWIQSSGVYLNGVIHWIVGTGKLKLKLENAFVICAFDVESEHFEELPLPLGSFRAGKVELELGVLGGCLTVNACYKNTISVWVMKDYGVAESWTKEYDIKDKLRGTFRAHPNVPRVLRVTEEGHVLLFFKHELQVHSLGKRGLVRLEVDRMPLVVHGACVHSPSFVSLKHAIAG